MCNVLPQICNDLPEKKTKRFQGKIYQREYKKKKKWQVLDLLGNKCALCNCDDERVLQIDHTNGGGSKEFKNIGFDRVSYHNKIIEVQGLGFQLLCANCNWIKRVVNNECGRT